MTPGQGKTWLALLGFLSWKPMSGYDIKNLVDVSLSYFWNVSYGQIYPTLKKLEAAGFADVDKTITKGNRVRNQYRITAKGQEALDTWLQEPVDLSIQRDEMQLKLFVGGHKDRVGMIQLIEDFRGQQVNRLKILKTEMEEIAPSVMSGSLPEEYAWMEPCDLDDERRKRAVQEQALIFQLSIRQGILKAQSRITWCDEAKALLENPPFVSTFSSR